MNKNIKQPAQFYFANLGADVMRCVSAAKRDDSGRYDSSLARARKTLSFLHKSGRSEAYEEGLLLLRALEYAEKSNMLDEFSADVNKIISPMMKRSFS